MNRHHLRPLLATLAIALAAGLTALLGGAASAQTATTDYDKDNDNLIEITTLEQLEAVGWDLDGNGVVDNVLNIDSYDAAFPDRADDMGCASGPAACKGYELAGSLDFNDDASYADVATNKTAWTTGDGWEPIGGSSGQFAGTFDGNGHTISNLYVNASGSYAGLFARIATTAGAVRNVGVASGSVTASGSGEAFAGGIAGKNVGVITDSWANVTVSAESTGSNAHAGGLVGSAEDGSAILRSFALGYVKADAGGDQHSFAGGLVGRNTDRIGASFATGNVLADSNSGTGGSTKGYDAYAGGLVGENNGGTVTASYATGDAKANRDSTRVGADSNGGGLAGRAWRGTIEYSYSLGTASTDVSGGSNNVSNKLGGLIGQARDDPTVTDSYWDTDTSGLTASDRGTGKTTEELKAPTGYTGIYATWNVDYDNDDATDDPWHFGTASDYPRLRHAVPMLDEVNVPSSGTLGAGDVVTVIVTFDKRVKVSGTPSLGIAIGGQTRDANYASTVSSPLVSPTTLMFTYAVKRGDNGAVTIPDGEIALGEGGAITDLSGSDETRPLSLAFTGASVPADLNAVTTPLDTTAPSVRYKPPSSLTVGQRIRTIVPITDDTDIVSYKLKEGSFLPRTLRLDDKTGRITGRPTRAIGRATVVTIVVCDAEPNCAEVTLKLPAIIDEEADAPPPEPQLPEVPPLDLSNVKVGDASPSRGLLLALASAGGALVVAGIGVAAVRRRAPSQSSPADWGRC